MNKRIDQFSLIIIICLLLLCGCNGNMAGVETDINNKTDITDSAGEDTANNGELPETKYMETVSPNMVFEPENETASTPLGYVAPDGWYVPRFTTGTVIGGNYDLVREVMGLKVYYVQKRLELFPDTWGYYRDETIWNVMRFQEENELMPTGDVDLATWKAMGFSEEAWNELGAYVTPVKIKREYDKLL